MKKIFIKNNLACTYSQPYPGNGEIYQAPLPKLNKTNPSKIKTQNIYAGIEVTSNKWIEMACEEARKAVTCKGGPFGTVILQIDDKTNEVLRYWVSHNHVTEWNDPTAHAEITAIRSACQSLQVFNLGKIYKTKSKLPQPGKTSHCEIYSSTEPCPMCIAAIYWAKIPVLYFASTRYDAAQQGVNFSDEKIYNELTLPYKNRKIKTAQCTPPNSLAAFNLWKRSKKIRY